jgi:hypothetical protein
MIVNYSVNGDSFHADQPRPWPEAKLFAGESWNFDMPPDGDRLALPSGARPAPKWERLDAPAQSR